MNVRSYLHQCRELVELCSQNGWIDNDTLHYEILDADAAYITAAVSFEEVVMEGSGCVAARVPCFGRVRLNVDAKGAVRSMELL